MVTPNCRTYFEKVQSRKWRPSTLLNVLGPGELGEARNRVPTHAGSTHIWTYSQQKSFLETYKFQTWYLWLAATCARFLVSRLPSTTVLRQSEQCLGVSDSINHKWTGKLQRAVEELWLTPFPSKTPKRVCCAAGPRYGPSQRNISNLKFIQTLISHCVPFFSNVSRPCMCRYPIMDLPHLPPA